ncbi:MAG: hypothetical protein EOO24_44715, partial [Comamonadaceae bacterium]
MTKNIPITRMLQAATLAVAALAALAPAAAQDKLVVKVLVGFPPGAGTDNLARIYAEALAHQLNVTTVVENKPGAGGQIAAQALKASAPDGHTLLLTHDHTISILPQVIRQPGFQPATDFTPVAGFATFSNVLALSGGTPARSIDEYVRWVKTQRAGKDTIGVPAPASIPEFLVRLMSQRYQLDLQAAPYRGSAPMTADMLGNQITAGIASVPDMIELHRAETVDDRLRRAVGREQPVVRVVVQMREAQFAEGGHLRQQRLALGADHGHDAQFAGAVQ